MAALDMSFEHGQPLEVAEGHFETGITRAESRFGTYLHSVEWGEDRRSARIRGTGFDVSLRLDERFVHAKGTIPFFARMFEAPVRRFLEETFQKPVRG
ncbi:MAG: hypothetical protein AB7I30_22885 [Isosphaeraceae bacterium]